MLHEKIQALEARLTELAQQEYAIDRDDTVSEAKARIESIINTTLEALAEMRSGVVNTTSEKLSANFRDNQCWAEVRVSTLDLMNQGDDLKKRVRQELARTLAHFISEKMVVREEHDLPRDQKVYRAEVYAFSPEEVKRQHNGGIVWHQYGHDQQMEWQREQLQHYWLDETNSVAEFVKKYEHSIATEEEWQRRKQQGVVSAANREQRRGGVQEKSWYDVHKKKA